jgi:predicted ATPase/DNA-binding CsgD family transcriptional regulator
MASTRFSQSGVKGRPRRLTSFVGREPEIETVTGLLARSDVHLVTLTGPGGIGKTRLAEQVLERLGDDFPDGAAFVDLSPLRDAGLVLPAIAQAVGVPNDPEQPLLARLHAFLAERRVLLVLDNFEHLADAVPIAVDLIFACPGLTILVTSRVRLHISGERVVPVHPLNVAAARALFIDRAVSLDPGFDPADGVTPTIDLICTRLDGLPLAIELAAARTSVLPPPALLARLERSLPLLSDGPRDAPDRQRGMRETIAWSFDLLPERQQALMRRLGVFIGGFTLEAATAVAGDGAYCFADLSGLVAASLVRPIPGIGDDPRFTLLETIGEYAQEQLGASGEDTAIQTRHAQYFQNLAEGALPHYDGPELPLWNARIDRELDNCRAAMTWALDHDEAETGTRLAGALTRVWLTTLTADSKAWNERVVEGLTWCERMLDRWPDQPIGSACESISGVGVMAAALGDADRARKAGEDLLARARAEDYPYGAYWAHFLLGTLNRALRYLGLPGLGPHVPKSSDEANGENLADARRHFEAALAIAPTIRNPENHTSMALHLLAETAWIAGERDDAGALYGKALALGRETGNPFALAAILFGYGWLQREMGQLRRAAACLTEAVEVLVSGFDSLLGMRLVLVALADIAQSAGQARRASRLLGAADAHWTPERLDLYEQVAARTRSDLGEPRFTEEWSAGRWFTMDNLVGEVGDLLTAMDSGHDRPALQHGLTTRERQVLKLVAAGNSNSAIANALSISVPTVKRHITTILGKLGLDSRTAAAAWAIRSGLD